MASMELSETNTQPKFKIVQLTVGELAENCYLFINQQTKEGFIVDPGDEAARIGVRVAHEQMTPKAILLTHGHFDHFLAADELAQCKIIEQYLPAMLSEAELTEALRAIIAQVGAAGPQDMGKVMGVATKQLAGKAEGKAINIKVRELLAQ